MYNVGTVIIVEKGDYETNVGVLIRQVLVGPIGIDVNMNGLKL